MGIFQKNSSVPLKRMVEPNTVGSKIIRALEISRVKKLMPNAVLMNKYLSSHDL